MYDINYSQLYLVVLRNFSHLYMFLAIFSCLHLTLAVYSHLDFSCLEQSLV